MLVNTIILTLVTSLSLGAQAGRSTPRVEREMRRLARQVELEERYLEERGRHHGRGRHHTTTTAAATTAAGTTAATTTAAGTTAAGTATTVATTAAATTTAVVAATNLTLNANILNCNLVVPANALTAKGLSTPFILQAPCSMAVATQQAFAEATVFDPATGAVTVYHPLIINQGTQPAAAPVVPKLPANAVVGIWFGFNGGVLVLQDANGGIVGNSAILANNKCIQGNQGVLHDVFGQVSWCNGPQFFTAVNNAKKTKVPPLGVTKAGNACPSTRSFQIVDACPNDNVVTSYLVNPTTGQTAQDTAANRAKLTAQGFVAINNASDEGLVAAIIDPALGCTPFMVPSLDDPGVMVASLATGELSSAAGQAAPISLIPLNDPDTLITVNGANTGGTSVTKTNTYRAGVNQNPINNVDTGALAPYCNNLQNVQPPFLALNQPIFAQITSPAANIGSNLLTFMCARYLMSLTQLGCPPPTGAQQTVTTTVDGNGVAITCTISAATANTTTTAAAATTTAATATKATTTAATTAGNLQTFTGALGGVAAGPVTASGAQFTTGGNKFNTLAAALQRSCAVQNNACANLANGMGQTATITVAQCTAQQTACNAAANGTGAATTTVAAAAATTPVAAAATTSAAAAATTPAAAATTAAAKGNKGGNKAANANANAAVAQTTTAAAAAVSTTAPAAAPAQATVGAGKGNKNGRRSSATEEIIRRRLPNFPQEGLWY